MKVASGPPSCKVNAAAETVSNPHLPSHVPIETPARKCPAAFVLSVGHCGGLRCARSSLSTVFQSLGSFIFTYHSLDVRLPNCYGHHIVLSLKALSYDTQRIRSVASSLPCLRQPLQPKICYKHGEENRRGVTVPRDCYRKRGNENTTST